MKKSAIKDINKTIRQLRGTPTWKDCLDLRDIPFQVTETGRVTRRVTRSKKANEEEEEVENMDLSFQSLTL